MESPHDAVFDALTAEVMDTLPADRWAVARIVTCLIQSDPSRWPELPGRQALREARFGCCRMQYTIIGTTAEIQGIDWGPSHG